MDWLAGCRKALWRVVKDGRRLGAQPWAQRADSELRATALTKVRTLETGRCPN